jgi:hypothetical protein
MKNKFRMLVIINFINLSSYHAMIMELLLYGIPETVPKYLSIIIMPIKEYNTAANFHHLHSITI